MSVSTLSVSRLGESRLRCPEDGAFLDPTPRGWLICQLCYRQYNLVSYSVERVVVV